MRYYLDTEFIERGHKHPVSLISVALVREDSSHYYAIDESAPLHLASRWVSDNVVPHLDMAHARPRYQIAQGLLEFVGNDVFPEFWGWYADYDWVVFCQIFGTMLDLPKRWPKFCMDLRQLSQTCGNPRMPESDAKTEHHALADAREIRERHRWLMNLRQD